MSTATVEHLTNCRCVECALEAQRRDLERNGPRRPQATVDLERRLGDDEELRALASSGPLPVVETGVGQRHGWPVVRLRVCWEIGRGAWERFGGPPTLASGEPNRQHVAWPRGQSGTWPRNPPDWHEHDFPVPPTADLQAFADELWRAALRERAESDCRAAARLKAAFPNGTTP